MKSKKIIAIVLAFASLMAIATSGLAATTVTTTTYSGEKIKVTTTVSGLAENQQVTYLAINSDAAPDETNIVYIDQKAPKAGATSVTFEYNVDRNKLKSLDVGFDVMTGTDGTALDEPQDAEFKIIEIEEKTGVADVVLAYTANAADNDFVAKESFIAGTSDGVFVKPSFNQGYEIDFENCANIENSASGVYKVANIADKVVVAAKTSVTTPSVSMPEITVSGNESKDDAGIITDTTVTQVEFETGKPVDAITKTALFDVKGNTNPADGNKITEVGVIIDGYRYRAIMSNDGGLCAVRVNVPKDKNVEVVSYHRIGDNIYKAGTTELIDTADDSNLNK